MLIVSFYTPDYAEHACNLADSCKRFGQPHWLESVPDVGSWVRNCSRKARFILKALECHSGDVLWLDADAVIERPLGRIRIGDPDFAVWHQERGPVRMRFRSGTVYFKQCHKAHMLALEWVDRCEAEPDIWDQEHLYNAWVDAPTNLETRFLPETYCKIFDKKDGIEDPHIVHYQHSRVTRRKAHA